LAVNRREHKRVVAAAVDRAAALVLRARSGHDQPVVARAVEVETGRLELELSLAGRHARAVCVLRDEAEIGFAGQKRVGRVSAGRRVDPAAAGHPAPIRVVDDDHRRQTADAAKVCVAVTVPFISLTTPACVTPSNIHCAVCVSPALSAKKPVKLTGVPTAKIAPLGGPVIVTTGAWLGMTWLNF